MADTKRDIRQRIALAAKTIEALYAGQERGAYETDANFVTAINAQTTIITTGTTAYVAASP
jgi:hypothetical protein